MFNLPSLNTSPNTTPTELRKEDSAPTPPRKISQGSSSDSQRKKRHSRPIEDCGESESSSGLEKRGMNLRYVAATPVTDLSRWKDSSSSTSGIDGDDSDFSPEGDGLGEW